MNQLVIKNKRFVGIDGLRGLLVLHVLLHHFLLTYHNILGPESFLVSISQLGYLSPRFFFVVSGFLIYYLFSLKIQSTVKPQRHFLINRFFRIFPLWWLTVSIYLLFGYLNSKEALVYSTFIFGFVGFELFKIPHAWSIFVEEFFYLPFAWFFKALNNAVKSFILTTFFYTISILWKKKAPEWGVPTTYGFVDFFPLANLHYFFLGIFCYHLINLKMLRLKAVEFLIYGIICGFFLLFKDQYHEILMFFLLLVIVNEQTWISKIISLYPLQVIGKACYPFYLIHFLMVNFFLQQTFQWTISNKEWALSSLLALEFLLLAVLVSLISISIHRFIERPIIRLGQMVNARLDVN